MKKVISNLIIIVFSLILLALIFLSTKGYETKGLNSFIIKKVVEAKPNIKLELNKVKIRIDLKKFRIFLSTNKPILELDKVNLPVSELRVYIGLIPILKSEVVFERIFVSLDEIKFAEVKKIALRMKPSNLKSFVLKNIKNGKIKTNLDLNFEKDLKLKNYNIDGYINNLDVNLNKKFNFKKTKLIYSVNKNSLLLSSISGELNNIPIYKGEIEVENFKAPNIKGYLNKKINLNEKKLKKITSNLIEEKFFLNNIILKGDLKNTFDLKFDETLKVKDFNLKINGNLIDSSIKFISKINSNFTNSISNVNTDKSNFEIQINSKKENLFLINGNYSLNNKKFQKYSFKNNKNNYSLNFDISEPMKLDIINYLKKDKIIANINTNFSVKEKIINFKNFLYKENENVIAVKNLKITKKNKFNSIKSLNVKTLINGKINNDFKISFDNKITIKGNNYDASNLLNLIEQKNTQNTFKNINKEISINLLNVETELKHKIKNFNLIGKIHKGKFIKLSSKGEFSNNKYLDLLLSKDVDSGNKYLEVYSDIPQALLSNYSFFKGVNSGKLLFTSTFNDDFSKSKLVIENFKVKNAPGLVKLLSLADFGGVADLVYGEGLSFDTLDMTLEKNKKELNIKELYAIGPSISVLVDGYIANDTGLVSLRGTMVPAKEINKLISKIPLIGEILIPKEVGEGLFGVSFKLKGKPGNIKTSVNPIKTITPRFITKALEKVKKAK